MLSRGAGCDMLRVGVVRPEEVEDGHGLVMRHVGMPFSFDVDYNAWRLVTRIVRVISECSWPLTSESWVGKNKTSSCSSSPA